MSQTFALVCREAKLKICVGQGWHAMTTFYSGIPEVMGRLGRFLEATRGQPLVLLCDDTQGSQFEDCAEFEDPEAGEEEGPNVKLRGSPASGRVPLECQVRRDYNQHAQPDPAL